ncbi:hypothetical protein SAMN02583745_02274 [Thorsellia anophelis DSM 18579]|uniref:Uncharacterized protein n=1 Tax=Thorsellia anophelis DSM 18579 TaxID=1123402 RepID=A0A1I0E6E7_9GAMM|nr:hypothetical protein SAMN02583745_02274 [Thorsellia anophelis DSM 18579]
MDDDPSGLYITSIRYKSPSVIQIIINRTVCILMQDEYARLLQTRQT